MFSGSRHNPTGRFDGLAGTYAKFRPDYPSQAIDWILERLPNPRGLIVDVGCGTGISTRQLAERGCRVIGIEPNESMRAEAATTASAGKVDYRAGRAEATGLQSDSADAVLAAQAFHWFDPDAALREFHRLIGDKGWANLLWNIANLDDPFTAGYWSILRESSPEPEVVEEPHHLTGQALLESPLFEDGAVRSTPHGQCLDEAGLLGRSFSASFAPKACDASRRIAERMSELFARYAVNDRVSIAYRTTVYQARRRTL
jgi:SAM-dependent methyltransferase